MWQTLLFIACALVVAGVAAHEAYRLGEHRGYMAGKRDGRNQLADELRREQTQARERALGAIAPRNRRGRSS